MAKYSNGAGAKIGRALALATATLVPTAVLADEVKLKSADGTVNLVGEFVDFVDDNYVIRTALGDLRISAARVSCEGAACPVFETATADIVFAGADTVAVGMMPLVLSGYASFLDAEASVKATGRDGEIIANLVGDGGFGDDIGSYLVTSNSSSQAFASLLDRSAMFGMADRRIQPDEARALKADGAGNMISPEQEHIIAVDSIVVITHPSNPVSSLTMDQVGDIYAGRISNWSEVGGSDAPITVVTRTAEDGAAFFTALYGDSQLAGRLGEVAPDGNTMAAMVNADENAIGFVGYAFQRGAKPISLVNSCGITSTPDAFSAKTEEYPLQRRMYIYTRADAIDGPGKEFLNFVTSEDADAVIAKSGFIDLGVITQSMDADSNRALQLLAGGGDAYEASFERDMFDAMTDYERLSTTFRFRTGSSRLDERALIDMRRLVDYLETQPDGTKVKFVGFTDSVGAFDSNRVLSEKRAAQVAEDLSTFAEGRLGNVQIEVSGYGEVAPTGCNATDRGRGINRRVEVWIQPAARS